MKDTPKYDAPASETEYQPKSSNRVLKNTLGITEPAEMNDVESELLLKLYEKIFIQNPGIEQLQLDTVLSWHKQWLANIYPAWAGRLRSTNISKDGFTFAAANQLERLLTTFEDDFLAAFKSLPLMSRQNIVELLAKSHVEFILIHPFREGNGRISRLLIDVMAEKAGYGVLDYKLWDEHKEFYIRSIQAGVSGDYQHMIRLMDDILPAD